MAFTPTDPTKAEVRVTGTAPNQQLDFYIPRGAKGEPGGWNTGTDLSTTTNLNDIKVPGLYRNWTNTAATALNNYPTGAVNATCTLEVIVAANPTGDVIQRITPMSGNSNILRVMYIRRCLSGTWTDWRTFNTTRVDQTAGRVIYQWDDLNMREQLVYGDTGWRNLTSVMNAGSATNSSGPYIRRVGSTVEIELGDQTITGTEGTVAANAGLITIPAGFQPVNTGGWLRGFCGRGDGASTSAMLIHWEIPVNGTNPFALRVMQYHRTPITGTQRVAGTIVYTTTDNWPTTLPGVVSGSIPNL